MKKICLSIVFLLTIFSGFAQQNRIITGKVTDQSNGQTLIGVSIGIKDSRTGAVTDADGKYSISIPSNKPTILVFKYIGYEPKEVVVDKQTIVNVVLVDESRSLEQVVVIGYGTTKKKDLTGSVGKVNMADMNKAPVRSFDEALAGRSAGVQVSSADGQPGAGISVVIRGNNSITQGNSPLYVVDGFPIEDPNNNIVNPNDIESLEVLKDASATAIYGARGANGVVIITTKKGKEGAPIISLDASYGLQKATKKIELMNPYEYVKYQLELDPTLVSTTPYPSPTQLYLAGGKTLDDYKNLSGTDWQGLVLQQAPMQNYNLSISGGSRQTKYAISGSIFDQDGVLINSGYKRYQGRIVLDQQVNDKMKVGINTNYSFLQQSGTSPAQNSFSGSNNVMTAIWGARPLSSVKGGLEEILQDPDFDPANDYRVNPIINLKNLIRFNKSKNLFANAYAEYAVLPNLKLRVTGGITDNQQRIEAFNNSKTQYGNPNQQNGVNGSLTFANTNSWLNENTLTWNNTNKIHAINILAGFTAQGGKSDSYGMSATTLPYEGLGLSGLDEAGATVQPLKATSSNWTMASVLSRVNYNYKSRYLFTASFRADGSSKFSEANHWSFFPSAAASWRFSEENWLKNNEVISEGKLRLSYGATGNNRVSDFGYLTAYSSPIESSYSFNNTYVPGLSPSLGNPNLKWETTKQTNFGVDLGFFKQRVEITVDLYRKNTSNLLLNAQLPGSSGFSSAFKNIGSVRNQGLEFSISTINIKKPDFSWTSNFNISFNQSKVLELAENQESLQSAIRWDSGWNNTTGYIAKLGMPLGLMYGYINDGVYNYSDFNRTVSGGYMLKDNIAANGNTRNLIQPGDVKYRDINGDLKVDANDYTVIGKGLPIHIGGFSNNFTYKNLDLNVFLQWSYGNDILNANRLWFEGAKGGSTMNQYASYTDRWSPSNQESTTPRAKGYSGSAGGYSTHLIEDGSYLRLKTVSLGYNFNTKMLQKLKIRSIRAYVSGQNLITWTNYSGLDPEASAYQTALTPGFDYSTYPRARTYTFGTKISF
jgi:TonB-linked SusC/RagA family outer membrane protein